MNLTKYYQDEHVLTEMFNSVSNPEKRYWKVVYTDGTVRQNHARINSIKRLRDFLLCPIEIDDNVVYTKIPEKVYVSISKWLQPQRNQGKSNKKAKWMCGDNIFLGSELYLDFDCENNLEIAREDAKTALQHILKNEPNYELANICFSGNKGFNLVFIDNKSYSEQNPIVRINKVMQERRRIVDSLPKLNTMNEVHEKIICDQYRVRAVIGSIKATTGNKVTNIPLTDFMELPFHQLKQTYVNRVVRPVPKPMISATFPHISDKERTTLSSSRQVVGQPVQPAYPLTYDFISNAVYGVKDKFIIVLKFPSYKEPYNRIKKAQQLYKLSDFHVFNYGDTKMYICIKIVDDRRLEKVMKFTKSMGLASQCFYGYSWIPVSETIDSNGEVIVPKPEYIGTISSNYGKEHTLSRQHALFFKTRDVAKLAGIASIKIGKAVVTKLGEQTA